jgi:ribose-phosphate pyrophosphokinase
MENSILQDLKIFSGASNKPLTDEVCRLFDFPQGNVNVGTFSDGEIQIEINENVRGTDVFLIQSTCTPVNNNLMELLILIDAMKRASAERITAVIPYYGYARQDRKAAPRAPISAKLVADLLTTAGANRVLTMDLHAGQIQGFFNIPVDNLYASPIIYKYLKEKYDNDLVIVSPDAGGVERARSMAKSLDTTIAIIDKRRLKPNEASVMNIIGEIEGKNALILDDMTDTAGTLTLGAKALTERGAKTVSACCTHPVLSGPAVKRINKSSLEELIVTNTIPLSEEAQKSDKINVLSVAELFAEAIKRIHINDSINSLFI